jgi:hypothetical protein
MRAALQRGALEKSKAEREALKVRIHFIEPRSPSANRVLAADKDNRARLRANELASNLFSWSQSERGDTAASKRTVACRRPLHGTRL